MTHVNLQVLKKRTDLYQTVWKRGAVESTRWEITAAHGGGYVYVLKHIYFFLIPHPAA